MGIGAGVLRSGSAVCLGGRIDRRRSGRFEDVGGMRCIGVDALRRCESGRGVEIASGRGGKLFADVKLGVVIIGACTAVSIERRQVGTVADGATVRTQST